MELRSLDSFGFERVAAIKIDVEGFENEVLAGATETIRRNRPAIVVEAYGGKFDERTTPEGLARTRETLRRIEAHGYSVERIGEQNSIDYVGLPLPP